MRRHRRYLEEQVLSDLREKMVFVSGPRQVGKTTLALSLPGAKSGYLNWDDRLSRARILRGELPEAPLWIFDEIHKYRSWRNFLKGIYDTRPSGQRLLVTGSGRLELYRRGGDSLQGRYHLLRMWPLSVAELGGKAAAALSDLLALGGFPEPFFRGSVAASRRWSREYQSRLVEEDVRDLERIVDFGNLELLLTRLPECVGSPLSINSLREDLALSHGTVARWLEVFERTFAIFRLSPFGAPRIRAVRKEQKHYHVDWSVVESDGPRFENLVACHLLKWVHFKQDTEGATTELRYFRDRDGREVDFVVTEKRVPVLLIECKLADTSPSPHLRYLKEKFPAAEAWQIHLGTGEFVSPQGIRVAPAWKLLSQWV